MSASHHRRLRRLEKLATPAIERVKQADQAHEKRVKELAEVHTYLFAALVLYGKPIAGEPLSEAWERCCQRFPELDRITSAGLRKSHEDAAIAVGEFLKGPVNSDLPGSTRKEKLQNLFNSAPPWLIWFTFADCSADLIGLQLPDLSSVENYAREPNVLDGWPDLPAGKFYFLPRDRSNDDLGSSLEEITFLKARVGIPKEELSRLERKRYKELYTNLVRRKLRLPPEEEAPGVR